MSDNAILNTSRIVDGLGGVPMTFAEVLNCYLKTMGISQSELARRMGTARQTVSSLCEDGRRGPRLDTALAVADALGVPIQEIVDKMKEA